MKKPRLYRRPKAAGAFERFDLAATGQSIPARFAEQARRFAQRPAISERGRTITYEELDRNSAALAADIGALAAAPEAPVALLFGNGGSFVTAVLSALRAGRFYVALDAAAPTEFNRAIFDDSTACGVITDSAHLDAARRLAGGRPVLNADDADTHGTAPGVDVSPDDLAYIYYTSGSTGRPKGVADTHRNVLHNVMRYANSLAISCEDRLSLVQAPPVSGAVSNIFSALLNGACVCPFDIGTDGLENLGAWALREGITVFHSVPLVFGRLVESGLRFPAMRLIRLEGDTARPRDVEIFRAHFRPGTILVNGLGATECGLVRQFFIDHDTELNDPGVPVGYPVEGVDVAVVDDDLEPLPCEEAGEIVVKSPYLAVGYWGRPDLTKAAFVEGPGGARLYRTGDLGRMDEDGCLHHLGRIDSSVKLRGNRIDTPFEVPRTVVEESLAKIWSQVLEIDRVGVNDDFLDLGGDSLRAMQVRARVADAFGLDVPLALLSEAPTVAALAPLIETLLTIAEPQVGGEFEGSTND